MVPKMEFDTSWDIGKYRAKFESQEHWELIEEFMLANKEKFSEIKILCLAQAYANTQLFGCRYPDEFMKQVSTLSIGLRKNCRVNGTKIAQFFEKALEENKNKFSDEILENQFESNNHIEKKSSKTISEINKLTYGFSSGPTGNSSENPLILNLAPSNSANKKKKSRDFSRLDYIDKKDLGIKDKTGADGEFKKNIEKVLWNFVNADTSKEGLLFSCEFSKIQRKAIDEILLNQLKDTLKSKCHKKSKMKFTIITKKKTKDRLSSTKRTATANMICTEDCSSAITVNHLDRPMSLAQAIDLESKFSALRIDSKMSSSVSKLPSANESLPTSQETSNNAQALAFLKFTLVLKAGQSSYYFDILTQSATYNNVQIETYFQRAIDSVWCVIKLSNLKIGCGNGCSEILAKLHAAKNAVISLRYECPAIEIQDYKNEFIDVSLDSLCAASPIQEYNRIPDDNVGSKLLRLMGWDGGPLGKNKNGITEPITIEATRGKKGLGQLKENKKIRALKPNIRKILHEYINDHKTKYLKFPPELTKEQRRALNEVMTEEPFRRSLKNRTCVKNKTHCMTISKKCSFDSRVKEILKSDETDMYKLYPPGAAKFGE